MQKHIANKEAKDILVEKVSNAISKTSASFSTKDGSITQTELKQYAKELKEHSKAIYALSRLLPIITLE